MKIGFYLKWPRGTSGARGCNIIGDELFAEAMCRVLSTIDSVESATIFAPNQRPHEDLDLMIYLNDTPPHPEWAEKHVLYMQNAYGEGSDLALEKFHKAHYDGYAFISNKLLEIHKSKGFEGIFLPFGVDNSFFYPRERVDGYSFDVAYVGNDIKGETRSSRYLLPARDFNFGLFGNWQNPQPSIKRRLIFWKPSDKIPTYKQEFFRLSKGKIPQAEVPVLYSSARINLNCTSQDCVDWDVITLRTFEVLACRGFLITDKVPVAEKTMQGCMVFTEGDKDLKDQIRYYLENETERLKIAGKGYEYATRFATLEMRMKELVSYLESIL